MKIPTDCISLSEGIEYAASSSGICQLNDLNFDPAAWHDYEIQLSTQIPVYHCASYGFFNAGFGHRDAVTEIEGDSRCPSWEPLRVSKRMISGYPIKRLIIFTSSQSHLHALRNTDMRECTLKAWCTSTIGNRPQLAPKHYFILHASV